MTIMGGSDQAHGPFPRLIARRTGGQILGRISAWLPCLLIGIRGSNWANVRGRRSRHVPGIFCVGARVSSPAGQVTLYEGFLLPVSLCTNPQTRETLCKVADVLTSPASLRRRRAEVNRLLAETFGPDLVQRPDSLTDSFVVFEWSAGLLDRLCAEFRYVTEIDDDSAGEARIISSQPFAWHRKADLVETLASRAPATNPVKVWRVPDIYLVTSEISSLRHLLDQRYSHARLLRPNLSLARWFQVRPGTVPVRVAFVMEEWGWARLEISLDDAPFATVDLSNCYCPFDDLISWTREVAEGDLPRGVAIDEEGSDAYLVAYPTDDPERLLFRVTRNTRNESVLAEGVVKRTDLARGFLDALIRFFQHDFAPEHWYFGDDDLPHDVTDREAARQAFIDQLGRIRIADVPAQDDASEGWGDGASGR